MKWLLALIAVGSLAGALFVLNGGDPHRMMTEFLTPDPNEGLARVCEEIAKQRLKSPSSYKRVSVTVAHPGADKNFPAMKVVYVSFDAANSYNAMIRGIAVCTMSAANGPFGVPHVMAASVDGRKLTQDDLLVYGTLAESKAAGH